MNPGFWDWGRARALGDFGRVWSVGDHIRAKSVHGAGLWSNPPWLTISSKLDATYSQAHTATMWL